MDSNTTGLQKKIGRVATVLRHHPNRSLPSKDYLRKLNIAWFFCDLMTLPKLTQAAPASFFPSFFSSFGPFFFSNSDGPKQVIPADQTSPPLICVYGKYGEEQIKGLHFPLHWKENIRLCFFRICKIQCSWLKYHSSLIYDTSWVGLLY